MWMILKSKSSFNYRYVRIVVLWLCVIWVCCYSKCEFVAEEFKYRVILLCYPAIKIDWLLILVFASESLDSLFLMCHIACKFTICLNPFRLMLIAKFCFLLPCYLLIMSKSFHNVILNWWCDHNFYSANGWISLLM